ncbi:MAG: amidohydrolase family protein [Polyangiaceae bacterium]|nr:amidohydrolase family protein [Polyangiaceae bacterium]
MYDLAITSGTVVDALGGEPFTADVAVSNGRIALVGKLDGPARRTIDASGAIVTPGFVDLHTHYDGQVSWDAELSPSSIHGVTTAIMGNCGVGFAPVREADRQTLIRLMEGVEDIPGSALSEGIDWRWESFPEYMAALDARPHSIDFALHVPHDALRVYVMGERGVNGEAATEADIVQMRALLREAMEQGAVGFSTGRTDNHRSADGKATPAAEATIAELTGIAKALNGLPYGVLQAVSDFDIDAGPARFEPEFEVVLAMAKAAPGHRTSMSLLQRDAASDQWERILKGCEKANSEGIPMRVQVAARAIGVLLGLEATFHPFVGFPSYKRISHLPLEERVRILSNPEVKKQLLTEKSEPLAGDGSAVPPLADKLLANLDFVAMRLFRIGKTPNYEPNVKDSLYGEALSTGRPVLDVVYDAMLADAGKELLYFPLFNYTGRNLDTVEQMLKHPLALAGLSDGGAHVGTVCDASFPTFMLMHWARDTKKIPLQKVVSMLCRETAEHAGMTDRGTITVGRRADLNVIDLKNLSLSRPGLHHDLPGGGRRLIQQANGYIATIVAGETIRDANGLTSARPGHLVRLGRS